MRSNGFANSASSSSLSTTRATFAWIFAITPGRAQMLAATGGVIVTPLRQALLSVRRLGDRDAATSRRQHYMFDTPLDARDVADSRNAGLWP